MYSALDVTRFLRRELCDRSLVVKLDHYTERWCVYERVRRETGRRAIPYVLKGDGTINRVPGARLYISSMEDVDELVHVHEAPDGSFLTLDPHVLCAAIAEKDSWRYPHRDVGAVHLARADAAKQRREKAFRDHVGDLAVEEAMPRVKKWAEASL